MHSKFDRQFLAASFVAALAFVAAPTPCQSPQPLQQPFAVVANQGQWDAKALYRANKAGAVAWFMADGWMFDLVGNRTKSPAPGAEQGGGRPQQRGPLADRDVGHALRLSFLNRSSDARILPEARQDGRFNFYLGNDQRRWRSGVPGYSRLRYQEMYPGIDVVIREGAGMFAYDLHLAAGVDPAMVQIQLRGADRMVHGDDGHLRFHTPIGVLVQSAPVAWYVLPGGERLPVDCRIKHLGEDRFGFLVEGQRRDLPLVIDPDWNWGTLFGGAGWEDFSCVTRSGAATGVRARIAAAGQTRSGNLPTTIGPGYTGVQDVMVALFDPTLTGTAQRVFATYIGGNDLEYTYDVEADIAGNTYVVGVTRSSATTGGYPVTTGALQTVWGGGGLEGFLSRLDGRGALAYSTMLGGSGDDRICRVHVDVGITKITLSGYSTSASPGSGKFQPTAGAYRTTNSGLQDAFVATLNTSPNIALSYLSLYGGTANEGWPYNAANTFWYDMGTMGMDVDAQGRIVISGSTWSTSGVPLVNAYQSVNRGFADAFLALFDPSKTGNAQMVYSSWFGGQDNEGPENVAFDPSRKGAFVVSGWTYSPNLWTTAGAFSRVFVGTLGSTNHNDIFVTWIDPTKGGQAQLVYSTFIGGTEWDGPSDMFVDARGLATMGGWTGTNMPTSPGAYLQKEPAGVTGPGHITRIFPGGNGKADLVYGTIISGTGTGNMYVGGVASDGVGGVLFSGNTASPTHPTPRGPYTANQGGRDAYVGRLWALNQGISVIGQASPAACAGALNFGAQGWPDRGNANFALHMWNAQPSRSGLLGVGSVLPNPVTFWCGVTLGINPLVIVPITSDVNGELRVPAPLAANLPPNTVVGAQVFIANSGCCVTTTHVLRIEP